MQKYMIGVVVFGFIPVIYCIIYYMSDVAEYLKLEDKRDLEDAENILVWQVSFLVAIWQGLGLQRLLLFRIFRMDCSGMFSRLLPFKFTPSLCTLRGICAVLGRRETERRLNKLLSPETSQNFFELADNTFSFFKFSSWVEDKMRVGATYDSAGFVRYQYSLFNCQLKFILFKHDNKLFFDMWWN